MAFDYNLDFKNTDFRQNPDLYRVGVGEQGVLLVQPYKSEILPHWKFKTPLDAHESSEIIYQKFLTYLENKDFVGADMARKFLQMGYTRSRRYANHKSGKKYTQATGDTNEGETYPYSSGSKHKKNPVAVYEPDRFTNEKAVSAEIFRQKWILAKENTDYQLQKAVFQKHFGK
jgi:hypothetical protein